MYKKIKDCKINYIQYGVESKNEVVLLHGWGQNIEMMNPIGNAIKDKYHVTVIDLPGFGLSEEPSTEFTIYDYFECIDLLLQELNIKNPIMVGHSFGGRISILYASIKKTKKLILLSAPFVKRITEDSSKTKILKGLKKVPVLKKLENVAKKFIGSEDYRNSTPMMRRILVNTVNEDLTDYVKKIKASTIVIAGELDVDVPLDEINLYKNYIEDCAIIVYPRCTHYAYLEDINKTNAIIKSFIGE